MARALLFVALLFVGINGYCFFRPPTNTDPADACVADPLNPPDCAGSGFECTDSDTCEELNTALTGSQYRTTFEDFTDIVWCGESDDIGGGFLSGMGGQTQNPCFGEAYSGCELGGALLANYPGSTLEQARGTSFETLEGNAAPPPMPGGWTFTDDTDPQGDEGPVVTNGATFYESCGFQGQGFTFIDNPTAATPDGSPANCGPCALFGADDWFAVELSSSGNQPGDMQSWRGCIEKTVDTIPGQNYDFSVWAVPHPSSGDTLININVPDLVDGDRYYSFSAVPGNLWSDQTWIQVATGFQADSDTATITLCDVNADRQGHSVVFAGFEFKPVGECCDCEDPFSCEDLLEFSDTQGAVSQIVSTNIPNICTNDVCAPGIGCVHLQVREAAVCFADLAPAPEGWPDSYTVIPNQLPPSNPPDNILIVNPDDKRSSVEQRQSGSPAPANSTLGWWVYSCQCGNCVFSQYYPSPASTLSVSGLLVVALSLILSLFA